MKNILVPTDFSIQASYALDVAYQLARKFRATFLARDEDRLKNQRAVNVIKDISPA